MRDELALAGAAKMEGMITTPEQPGTIPYALPDTAMRWSPLPLMIGSGCCGLLLIALCRFESKFQQIFLDFGVKLPAVTRFTMYLAELVWHRGGWALLLPLMIVWPLGMLRMVHAQPTLQQRRRRIRIAWLTLVAISILSVVTVVVETVPAMLALVN
jgi:hypothetical protein